MAAKKWEKFQLSVAEVLVTTHHILQLISNTKDNPCLHKAINLLNDGRFVTSRFTVLLEPSDAEGSCGNEEKFRDCYNKVHHIMRSLTGDSVCRIDGYCFEAQPALAESAAFNDVKLECEKLLNATIKPENSHFVDQAHLSNDLPSDAIVLQESSLTLKTILSWSDAEYFSRLNAYSVLRSTQFRHPLEKFLMRLCEEIEQLDFDMQAVKTNPRHRFRKLSSFVYYFSERAHGLLRTPLQDILVASLAVLYYVRLVVDHAKKVGLPLELENLIEADISPINAWFETRHSFHELKAIAEAQIQRVDLETDLHEFFIFSITDTMDTFRRAMSDLLIDSYPKFGSGGEGRADEDGQNKYDIYRECYCDVASQLKDSVVLLKVQLGDTASGLMKEYGVIQEALQDIARARKERSQNASRSGQQLSEEDLDAVKATFLAKKQMIAEKGATGVRVSPQLRLTPCSVSGSTRKSTGAVTPRGLAAPVACRQSPASRSNPTTPDHYAPPNGEEGSPRTPEVRRAQVIESEKNAKRSTLFGFIGSFFSREKPAASPRQAAELRVEENAQRGEQQSGRSLSKGGNDSEGAI